MAVTEVVMPKLSEAMETGRIIKWLKKEGDRVQGGDILAEVETDKADVEMEAFGAGVLRKILVPAGEHAPVGAMIGVIAEADEDLSSVLAGATAPAGSGASAQKESPAVPAAATASAPGGGMSARPASVPPQPRSEDPAARQPAPSQSPVAPARPGAPPPPPSRPEPVTAATTQQRGEASPLAKKVAA